MRPRPGITLVLRLSLSALSFSAASACTSDPKRGRAGESCTSADDCGDGLGCYGQVCVAAATAGSGGTPSVGAPAGSPCQSRRDCAPGLTCIMNLCEAASTGTSGDRLSRLGESCQAKNDCQGELACVMSVCRAVDVALTRTAKSCYRVECATKADCCAGFKPHASCPAHEMNCAMDPIFCNTYRSLCVCGEDCVEEQCVAAAAGCKSNAECTSVQTPYCVEGKCSQCDQDSACSAGTKCSDGVCTAPCKQDEHCPLLNQCQSGVCVPGGCTTDRECAFVTSNAAAVCRDKECSVPCANDADCQPETTMRTKSFEVCEQGRCVFVGCENDAECRALFGLENGADMTRAICR